ncbi:MAG: acyl carrier protein [Gammaproteobacteria bacterium]|jgi:acyl carrier protein|nr:acyl carrier protein [Gammaproteobacteria bacterium]
MPTHAEICSALYDVLQPFAAEGQVLDEDTDLTADLDLSSLKIMELLMDIEDRYDITVPLNVLPDVRTVRDLAVQLDRLIQQAG